MYKKLSLLALFLWSHQVGASQKRVCAPMPGQVEAENIEDESLRHRMMIEVQQNAMTNVMLAQRREREEAIRNQARALSDSASNLLRYGNDIEDINQMVAQLEKFATEFSSVSIYQANQMRNQARMLRQRANNLQQDSNLSPITNLPTTAGAYPPRSSRNLLQAFQSSSNE